MDDYDLIESLTDHHHIASKVEDRESDEKTYFLLTFTPLPIPLTNEIRKRVDVMLFLKERNIIQLHDAFYINQTTQEYEVKDVEQVENIVQTHFVTVEELDPELISLRHYLFNIDENAIPNSFVRYILRDTMKCLIHLHALHHPYGNLSPLQILIPEDIVEEFHRSGNIDLNKSSIRLRPFSVTTVREKPNYSSKEKVLDPYTFQVSTNGEFSMMEFNERPIWYAPPEEILSSSTKMNISSFSSLRSNKRNNEPNANDSEQKTSEVTVEGDIWMFGCIMAELLLPFPLFSANELEDQIRNTIQLLGPPVSTRLKPDPTNEMNFLHRKKETNTSESSKNVSSVRDFRITNLVKLLRVSRHNRFEINFSAIQILVWLLEYDSLKRPDISVLMDLPIFQRKYKIPFYKIKTENSNVQFIDEVKSKKKDDEKVNLDTSPLLVKRLKDVEKSLEDTFDFDKNFSLFPKEKEQEQKEKKSPMKKIETKNENDDVEKSQIRERIEEKLNLLEKESLMLVTMLNDPGNSSFMNIPKDMNFTSSTSTSSTHKEEGEKVTPTSLLEEFDDGIDKLMKKRNKKKKKQKKRKKKKAKVYTESDVTKLLTQQRKEYESSIRKLKHEVSIKQEKVKFPVRKSNTSKQQPLEEIESLREDDETKTVVISEIETPMKNQMEMEEEDVIFDERNERSFISTASSPPRPRKNTPTPSSIDRRIHAKRSSRRRIHKSSLYTPTERISEVSGEVDFASHKFEIKIQVLGGFKPFILNKYHQKRRRTKTQKKSLMKNIMITYSWDGIQEFWNQSQQSDRKRTKLEKKMSCRVIRSSSSSTPKTEQMQKRSPEFLVWTMKEKTNKNEKSFRCPVILKVWEMNEEEEEQQQQEEEERRKRRRKNGKHTKCLGRCEVDIFLLSLYDERFKFSGWFDVLDVQKQVAVGKIKVVCGIRRRRTRRDTVPIGFDGFDGRMKNRNEDDDDTNTTIMIEKDDREEEEDNDVTKEGLFDESDHDDEDDENDNEIIKSLRNIREKLREFNVK